MRAAEFCFAPGGKLPRPAGLSTFKSSRAKAPEERGRQTSRCALEESGLGGRGVADWREFRARLIERERTESLLDVGKDLAGESNLSEEGWLHAMPFIEKGSVLLARPGLWSIHWPAFHKAVVLIAVHQEGYGDMGFILNRPTCRTARFGDIQFNVWYGGPCHGFEAPASDQWACCLHTRPDLSDSEAVAQGIFVTEPWVACNQIARGKARAEDFMYLVGHCGWAAGQLASELKGSSAHWLMVAVDTQTLLRPLSRQQAAMQRSGNAVSGRGLSTWRRLVKRAVESKALRSARMLEASRHADEVLLQWVHTHLTGSGPELTGTGQPVLAEALRLQIEEAKLQTKEALQKTLALMEGEPSAPNVQEYGCKALRNMVIDDASRKTVVAHGGVEMVLAAMRLHDHPRVLSHCLETLTSLAVGAEEQRQIFSLGGIPAVLIGMYANQEDVSVQYKACALLARLASGASGQLEVASSGATAALVRAMKAHQDEDNVQNFCLEALYNIARADENRAGIAAAGGIGVVQQTIREHPDLPAVRRIGQSLLEILQ